MELEITPLKIVSTQKFNYHKQLFSELNLQYVDIDINQVKEYEFTDNDIIVLTGEDVLNDYVLDVIIEKFTGRNNKIIAVSVSLPNKSILINTFKLNIIDYIFIQSKQDYTLFTQYFDPHRVLILPSISATSSSASTNLINRIASIKNSGQKVVCLSLSLNLNSTLRIIIGHFVKFLLNFDYHVVFVPLAEQDIKLHEEIIENSMINNRRNVTFVDEILEQNEYFQLQELLDVYIATDFFPCYTAVLKGIPIFPIFTSRSVKNLLLDIHWHYGYEMRCNEKMEPIELDIKILMDRFVSLITSEDLGDHLKNQTATLFRDFNIGKEALKEILQIQYSKYNVKSLQMNYTSPLDKKIQVTLNSVQEYVKSCGYSDFRKVKEPNIQDVIVCMVSFYLTDGRIRSMYNNGLKQKMFNELSDYDYYSEWKWIITDCIQQEPLISNPYGLFNLGFIDQVDYSESHRSGWQYVYDNIKYLHCDKSHLLLDLYIDRTFHWNREINKALGIIPFKKYWIGFIHHTFDTLFSDYNCHNLLSCDEFKESLPFCKGLFVLSKTLKQKLENELQGVPVFYVAHPIETNVPKFTMAKFLGNGDKKLIHVGGWLRNTYAFYNIQLPQETKVRSSIFRPFKKQVINLRKVALIGKNMSNYYPEIEFKDKLQNSLSSSNIISSSPNALGTVSSNISSSPNALGTVSSNISNNINSKVTNNWYGHFYEDTIRKCNSVDMMGYLNNKEYDTLLTENIVFIYLVDASAVNTLLECVIRNTPIIVNKIPAVVEVLGEKYPLYINIDNSVGYCEINKQVNDLLRDTRKISSAHKYLKKLKKEYLNIRNFKAEFINIVSLIHKTIVV
jgi:hypothetical protein